MKIIQNFPSKQLADSATIPPLLLAFAFVCMFIFQNDAHSFQIGHHGFLSSHGMTVSAHLSPEHRFLMINRLLRNEDDSVRYSLYNRFPIGAFASIRLATFPFQHDLSMQISIARNLMNTFFIAAAYFAYLSLLRLGKSKWVAVTATLLAFSSYYCLYYNDMIFNDIPTMFGLLLTFHGMVVFVQEGRFLQLVVKSCVALFFGWQAYAILLPFTLIGFAADLVKTRSLRSFIQSRFLILGITSLLFGVSILTINLAGEYFAIDVPLQELPTVQKMQWRLGLADPQVYDKFEPELSWLSFIQEQAFRIGKMSLPHTLSKYVTTSEMLMLWGGIAFAVSLVAAVRSRWRILTVSLVISGLCWALPLRHFVAFHDFQSIYYIGIPLFAYYLLALSIERFPKIRVALIFIALLLFLNSSIQLNKKKTAYTNGTNIITAEFQRIADRVGTQRSIFINGNHTTMGGGGFHATSFYLAKNYVVLTREEADFIISATPIEDATLFTPENRMALLYQPIKGASVTDTNHETTVANALSLTKTIMQSSHVPTGTITLLPFVDTNTNGRMDAGETIETGIVVSLTDVADKIIDTTESGDAGINFTDLKAGKYTLVIDDGGTRHALIGQEIPIDLGASDEQGMIIYMGIVE